MEKQLKTITHVYSTVYHGEEKCLEEAILLPINNAIIYPNNKILYKKSDNNIDFIDISNIDKQIFFDKGSNQDTVYDNVIKKYNLAKNRLNFNPDEYQCEMIDSGYKFILNLIDNKLPTIIAISEIYPTYFDLGLCSNDSNSRCLDYSCRNVDNLIHSGDVNIGNSLLHCISGQFNNRMKYVTIISGYSNTPLYRYIERRPIVTIIDHEKKIIYIVSVPLDQFTIGESTICLPIEESVEEEQTNEETKEIIIDSYKSTLLNHVECEQSDKEEYKTSSSSVTMGKHSVLIYSEYQNIYSNEELDIGQHHFPNLIPVKGVAILFASKTVPKVNTNHKQIEKIRKIIFENTFPIFIIGKMDDLCRQVSIQLKITGIYICIVDYPGDIIMIDDQKRNEFLENTCMNGVTAYAGPLSIVLIGILNANTQILQYFYVDGIQYESFIDFIPTFGTDITKIIENKMLNYIKNHSSDNCIVDISKEIILFNNEFLSFDIFKNKMIEMTLDNIINNKYKILDVPSQCQRLYDSEIMNKYSNELVLLLENKISQVINEYKKSFIYIFESTMDNKQKL
ncbi:unnamed protein product [Didymodactylos carnosus]|uniref:Uncharacterized protein n=1 Tax=Didymodactylos carnosus TaxID=1234261 RepID=A0A814B7E4_9BILA|nr:unnamed protein product [Didymodactylos carnosus]CAF3704099.1 unnamed protein product [Didymodactylos carnosus]